MERSLARLQVYLFGRFSVERGGQIVSGFEARRLQGIFSYLLLHRQRRCSREILASLFWGESSGEQAKKNLRQTLWQLQTVLETGADGDAERALSITPDWVQINPRSDLWLDVDFFEEVWNQTRNTPGKDLDEVHAQFLRNAIALQQAVLLPDNYDDWCLRERERLLSLCLAMLEKLMEHSEAQHHYEEALHYGLRILDFDRVRETAHQRLMYLYYLLGQRVEALKQYRQCEGAFLEEFGALPSKDTRALYEYILLDQLKSEPDAGTLVGNQQGDGTLLENILKELHTVRSLQTQAQHRVGLHIQKIEQMLQTLTLSSTLEPLSAIKPAPEMDALHFENPGEDRTASLSLQIRAAKG
jgi:DNA-binding SARP family transcriptional activator